MQHVVDQAVRLTLNHHLLVQSQSQGPPHLRPSLTQVQSLRVRENVTLGDVFLGEMTAGAVQLPHPVPQIAPANEIDS